MMKDSFFIRWAVLVFMLIMYQGGLFSQCDNERLPAIPSNVKKSNTAKLGTGKVIGIYLETDLFTYNAFGGNEEALKKWIFDRFLDMAQVYANEGISCALTGYQWPISTADDWSNAVFNNGSAAVLNEFARVRGNSPQGRLKHFISLRGSFVGIAWVNVLESNMFTFPGCGGTCYAGPYAVSLGLTGFTSDHPSNWNKVVLSHEMAHNIGSDHTFDCVWGNGNQAIDRCQGNTCSLSSMAETNTVMSYCGAQWTVGFGQEIGDLLRQKVQQSNVDLLGGHTPIILSLAGNTIGQYDYLEEVIFHRSYSVDSDLTLSKF